MTVTYLRDLAQQGGFKTDALTVAEIGWNGECFVDLAENRIHSIYKLYPWEWLLAETFGKHLVDTYHQMQWIEPIWKMVASNKGILAILWEIYPDHPLLLEAHIDKPALMVDYVRKPLYSREGANITVFGPAPASKQVLPPSQALYRLARGTCRQSDRAVSRPLPGDACGSVCA